MERASRIRKRNTQLSDQRLIDLEQMKEMGGAPSKKVKKFNAKEENSRQFLLSKIPQIPAITLTMSQMNGDPVQLLLRLQQQHEQFGAIKLVTPSEWNPPFCFKSSDKGITTRIQHLYKLKYGKAFKQKQEAYNIRSFRDFAQDFQKNYKYRFPKISGNQEDQQENEYWQLVRGIYQGPQWKFKVTTEYAADLPVKKYGSGFPISETLKSQDESFNYYKNLFNLNNIYKSPLSILKIADDKKQYISGVTTPWVYMGMLFSTFCWHVEDLWLNSLNYSHCGATKTWYVVPRKYKEKFDAFVREKTSRDDLLNRITFMLDPLQLLKNGIEVYKTHQRPGEYVCTFFKAYHAGFSHGYNVGEAVNFASPKSLNYISEAMTACNLKKHHPPFVLSYEWLVYQNMMRQQRFGKFDKIIGLEYDKILKDQNLFLSFTSRKCKILDGQEISSKAKYDKNSCSICKNYQYLSSLKCLKCNKNYCSKHFIICCQGQYQLIYRQQNTDRSQISHFIQKKMRKKKKQ